MAESKYTQKVLENFVLEFPTGWVGELDWSTPEKAKESLQSGVGSIFVFRRSLFLNYAKLVLSGDHLINEVSDLDKLSKLTEEDIPMLDDSARSKLQGKFSAMLNDIQESVKLVKYHCDTVNARYRLDGHKFSLNAISRFRGAGESSLGGLVDLLDMVCEACWMEYCFSNDDAYVRRILILKQQIPFAESQIRDDVSVVIGAVLEKLDFLLLKLSHFSVDKKIVYRYNFVPEIISIDPSIPFEDQSLVSLFLYFLEPSRIDPSKIDEWQSQFLKPDVCMWHLAFLMRYYAQKTRSLPLVDKVLELAEKHYLEYVQKRTGPERAQYPESYNVVNDYAGRSFRNYMYNSRFSILCSSDTYTYEQMKMDIDKIRSVQNETFIFNYHPYQKAVEYTFRYIESKLSEKKEVEYLELRSILAFLRKCYDDFKTNVKWCESYQPYLMQMRFRFCRKGSSGRDFPVFYPSSFCRPLNFQRLEDQIAEYRERISHLEYHIAHIEERNNLIRTHQKIVEIERNNMKVMGLFASVTTFFVGLLSIFIGNGGEVSIFDKMEYVIALALILVVFISLGYFVVSNIKEFWKRLVFSFALVAASVVLYCLLAN